MSYEAEILRLIRLRLQVQEILQVIEDRTAGAIGEIADRLIERMKSLMAGDMRGREAELIATVDELLSLGSVASADVMLASVDAVIDMSLRLAREAARLFDIPPTRLETLTRNFDATFRPDLRTAGYQDWLARMPEETLRPLSNLRTVLEAGSRLGTPTNKVARAFVRGAELELRGDVLKINDLPDIQQQIEPYARARRVVRTEYARIDNATSIQFSESYGASKYKNLGVGDERQSEECRIASLSEPRTLDSWRAFKSGGLYIGLAPRHYANCRCEMIGVPDDYRDTVDDADVIEAGGASV